MFYGQNRAVVPEGLRVPVLSPQGTAAVLVRPARRARPETAFQVGQNIPIPYAQWCLSCVYGVMGQNNPTTPEEATVVVGSSKALSLLSGVRATVHPPKCPCNVCPEGH